MKPDSEDPDRSDPDRTCTDPSEGSPPYGPGVTRQPWGAGIRTTGADEDEDLPNTSNEEASAESALFDTIEPSDYKSK
ncbi:hypothetical protein BH23VER1_BH23VER1_11130 [soil metagenome]